MPFNTSNVYWNACMHFQVWLVWSNRVCKSMHDLYPHWMLSAATVWPGVQPEVAGRSGAVLRHHGTGHRSCDLLHIFRQVCIQSFVIMEQDIGAVMASMFSDRCVYNLLSSWDRVSGLWWPPYFKAGVDVQSFGIMAQDIGAVMASIFSDRCVYMQPSGWEENPRSCLTQK